MYTLKVVLKLDIKLNGLDRFNKTFLKNFLQRCYQGELYYISIFIET